MDLMEETGLKTMIGKVNMDRNSPDYLREQGAEESEQETLLWLKETGSKYENVKPILTPRFIPSCTDDLMERLGRLQKEQGLPVQSHLSENQGEVKWVKELCPASEFYGDAYDQFGLFGENGKTVMAHCVSSSEEEIELIKKIVGFMLLIALSLIPTYHQGSLRSELIWTESLMLGLELTWQEEAGNPFSVPWQMPFRCQSLDGG